MYSLINDNTNKTMCVKSIQYTDNANFYLMLIHIIPNHDNFWAFLVTVKFDFWHSVKNCVVLQVLGVNVIKCFSMKDLQKSAQLDN